MIIVIRCVLPFALFCFHAVAVGQVETCDKPVVDAVGEAIGENVEAIGENVEAKNEPKAKTAPEFLKPLINTELSFVKRVCQLTDDQMKPVVVAARKAHQAMAEIVVDQETMGEDFLSKNKVVFTGTNDELMIVNPYRRVRDDVAQFLKPLVTDEQYSRFVEESRLRDLFERETAIGHLLGLIDLRVSLSVVQREKLKETLMHEWKDEYLHLMDAYIMSPDSFIEIPDDLIHPILNGAQQKLLASQRCDPIHLEVGAEDILNIPENWLGE